MKTLFAVLAGWLVSTSVAMAAVNINTATADQLQSLKGVGKAKAEAIVKYREQHGAFKTVDELDAVKGIGPSLIEKNRAEMAVSGATEAKDKAGKPVAKADPAAKPKKVADAADAGTADAGGKGKSLLSKAAGMLTPGSRN